MEELTLKKYTILLSAPSDVDVYLKNVQKAITKYNQQLGFDTGIIFETKHWKEDVYPDYGSSAQDIINKQIVEKSEIVIALFGARIGTPTDKFESGTIEEIVKISEMGGKVLTFFATGKLVDIGSMDPVQLAKVQAFKKKYFGLYNEFSSVKKLEEGVYTALKNLAVSLRNEDGAVLQIKSYAQETVYDYLAFEHFDFSAHFSSFEDDIQKQYEQVNNIKIALPEKETKYLKSYFNNPFLDSILAKENEKPIVVATAVYGEAVTFSEEVKLTIIEYYRDKNITIDDDFFYIGDLRKKDEPIFETRYYGTDLEKKRYEAIISLYNKIIEYTGIVDFISHFHKHYRLTLVLENSGKVFCDDISILLKFSAKGFNTLKEIEFTELNSAQQLQSFVGECLRPKATTSIDDMYEGSTFLPDFIPQPINFGGYTNYTQPDLDYYNNYLEAELSNIYPYIIDNKNGEIKLKISIKELKQFSSIFICGALIFDEPINEIEYTITTKSLGRQIKGVLKCK